jgi:hypothetical protein
LRRQTNGVFASLEQAGKQRDGLSRSAGSSGIEHFPGSSLRARSTDRINGLWGDLSWAGLGQSRCEAGDGLIDLAELISQAFQQP